MNMQYSFEPGETKYFPLGGGRFYFEEGAGVIRVKTVGIDSADYELEPGMGFQNKPDMQNFFGVEITNLSSVSQEISFIVTYREVFDNRVSFGGSAITVRQSTIVVRNERVSFVGVTGTNSELILAADVNRVRAVVKFESACRVGGSLGNTGIGAINRFPVHAGDILEWRSQDELRAYQTVASSNVYSLVEVLA